MSLEYCSAYLKFTQLSDSLLDPSKCFQGPSQLFDFWGFDVHVLSGRSQDHPLTESEDKARVIFFNTHKCYPHNRFKLDHSNSGHSCLKTASLGLEKGFCGFQRTVRFTCPHARLSARFVVSLNISLLANDPLVPVTVVTQTHLSYVCVCMYLDKSAWCDFVYVLSMF